MTPAFSPSALLGELAKYPPAAGYWVAYSGGRDSTVLLHALAQCRDALPAPLRAVHVDHGLQSAAAAWGEQCARQCARLEIPLQCLSVDAGPRRGESPEAAAREARYAALRDLLADGEVLLTAHHRDDQGETLLLQLFRGSGPRGLAAMPVRMPLGRGTLMRALLGFTRADLAAWAGQQHLSWVEDPSNRDESLDRNFLRHRVLPLLEARWPAVERTLARAADHQQDASVLMDLVASDDLLQVADHGDASLDGAHLLGLEPMRIRNLLRLWLRRCGLRPPTRRVLERVLTELLPAASDRNPVVHWHGGEVRRYRGRLYALATPRAAVEPGSRAWDLSSPLAFAGGMLTADRVRGQGLRASACVGGVRVAARIGGESCRSRGRQHHQRLKSLMQQAGIPPWERERLPLLFIAGQMVQAVGLCLGDEWAAKADEEGVVVQFHPRGYRLAEGPTAG